MIYQFKKIRINATKPWMAQIIFVIYPLKHGKHGDFPQLR